jgi:beta-glucanase (GH16 family)
MPERTRRDPKYELRMKFVAVLLAITTAATATPEEFPGWKLIWNDEFDGKSIDSTKWQPCERGPSDWNDTMTRDSRCFAIGGGTLKLIGIVNPDTSKDKSAFLTGGITSKGKFAFHHGRVLVHARFKSARGAWPAIWMMGENGRWPRNGEIDLMEHLNFDDKVYQTIHSYYANEVDKSRNNPPKGTTTPIQRDDYHTYGADWDDREIVFTVNGKPTLTYPRVPEKGPDQWPFNQPFYLILSMQIEGKWVGKADPEHYPAHMEIDWVRVYQKDR